MFPKMNEFILKYTEPAKNFNEALPIGNGSLGAMVYGRCDTERLSLNHDTLWSGKPFKATREGAYEAYCRARNAMDNDDPARAEEELECGFVSYDTATYLPLGDLFIEYNNGKAVSNYQRRLDMKSGAVYTDCDLHSAIHFVSHKYRCLITVLKFTDTNGSVKLRLTSQLKNEICEYEGGLLLSGQCPTLMGRKGIINYGTEGIKFTTILKAVTDGEKNVCDGILEIKNASYAELFLCTETSYRDHNCSSLNDYSERAKSECVLAVLEGADKLFSENSEYYAEKLGAVSLELDSGIYDTDTVSRLSEEEKNASLVELLFNYGRYLIIASSSPDSQATNLQGIWNEELVPPWKSNYTVNINTEMNYWSTLPCGLTEFHIPVIELLKKLSDNGRETAKEFYHVGGYVAHHNADIWGNTPAVGTYGEGEILRGTTVYSHWCGASGWLCRNVFEYYEYTLDIEFLKNTAFPLMKGAAEFYLDMLREVDGRLAISPSTSPENKYQLNGKSFAIAKYTTMTQSIVADLFKNCIRTCDILGIDDEFKTRIAEALPRLKPYKLDSEGRIMEWDREYEECDRQHRHVSHLYGLYPADLITTESSPELANAVKRSLEVRGDDGTGWSLAWKACLWAKLKDGDHALKLIKRQLMLVSSETLKCNLHNGGTYPNLLDAHPPFQIDGNFGITAAIALLFLQCEDNKLKILPALPSEFANGCVKGLKAKGNITVDIEWKNGSVTSVRLYSPTAQSVVLQYKGKDNYIKLSQNKEYLFKPNAPCVDDTNYLIVVDMQNDFIDGSLGTPEAVDVVSNVKKAIDDFNGRIIFTRDTHDDDYLNTREGKRLPVPHCIKGSNGWQITDKLDTSMAFAVIDKPTFGSWKLIELLESENKISKIKSVTLIGVCTDICVISNAMLIKARFPEVDINVIANCCAGVNKEGHERALSAMEACQIDIIRS